MTNEIQFILYQLPDEEGRVQVVIKDETIWATQKAMAQLFGVGVPAISKHLAHIFEEGELDKNVAVSKMEITTQHGAIEGKTQTNETAFYSLDAIIAVGYRVSSARATKFRIWATKILNEYILKGFCTKETWFYRMDMPEGYKHFSKTKPMLRDHCQPMIDWWNNRQEIIDSETGDEKSRCFTAQQLLDLGCNFDQCKFPKEEEEVLRPEELLKQYHEKRTALDTKIDATLNEIQQMLGIEIQ